MRDVDWGVLLDDLESQDHDGVSPLTANGKSDIETIIETAKAAIASAAQKNAKQVSASLK